MMTEPIMCALIKMITFLGLSDEDVVNEDAATSQLEEVAAILHRLNDHDRREFVRFVQEMAERELAAPGGAERSRFISKIPENLGLRVD